MSYVSWFPLNPIRVGNDSYLRPNDVPTCRHDDRNFTLKMCAKFNLFFTSCHIPGDFYIKAFSCCHFGGQFLFFGGMYYLLKELAPHSKAISAVKFSEDGATFATASADCTVGIFETETAKQKSILDAKLRQGLNDVVWVPGISGGSLLATCSDDRTVMVWDVSSEKLLHRFSGHKGFVFCLAVHARNSLLMSGSYDGTVRLWDIRQKDCVASFDAHSEPVSSVDFRCPKSFDSVCASQEEVYGGAWTDEFCTGGGDGLVRTWDLRSQQCLRTHILNSTVNGATVSVGLARYTPDCQHLLIGSLDHRLSLWAARRARTATDVTGAGAPCPVLQSYTSSHYRAQAYCCAAALPRSSVGDRRHLAAGSETGYVVLWDIVTGVEIQAIRAQDDIVLGLDTTENGDLLLSSGGAGDPTVRMWARQQQQQQAPENVLASLSSGELLVAEEEMNVCQ